MPSARSFSFAFSTKVNGGPERKLVREPSVARIISERRKKARNRLVQKKRLPRHETLRQRGRKMSAEATIPRSTRTPPAAMSRGSTQEKGTRIIASIRAPKSTRESPRVQFSQRFHHCPGL